MSFAYSLAYSNNLTQQMGIISDKDLLQIW